MKKLYGEPAAYSTADIANALMNERERKLPVRSSFFGGIVPQVSAQDAAVNRPILDESQRGQPGVISKLLIGGAANAAETFGLPGVFDPSGDIRNQSWGNALKASAWIPQDSVEGIAQAITAPARAVRGEIPDEDMISEGLNFAGNMAMTGSIAPKPTNAAGMFGGRLAKTADHAKLATAEDMAAKGLPREDIWSQTGWFKGVDGKWRFEIDDSGATYNGAGPGQLKNLFDHNNLYAAYPQMKTWGVTPIDDVNVGAYYNSAQGAKRPIWAQLIDRVIGYNPHTIVAGPKNADKTTLLHELTHGVQDIEGVSMPSGSAYYSGDLKSYNNMANEVEARAVQKRMDLTPEQRSSRPPWLDYDVPESQQIVRFNANSSEAAAPGVVVSEAARQPLEVPFYRGSAHGQTSVDYSQPYWGVSHGIPDVAQKLASHYAKSRSGMYFNADTTPNVTPAVARFRNPLEVDAQNAGWSQIPFEGGTISTDKLADLAKERGHDGLVVNRLYDEGRVDEALGLPSTVAALRPGTVSSAFDPNNILYSNGAKSAAPGVVLSEASKRVENQIRAYHGSPHDFDRFDMSKIGSGEGAQAYGHGLYFAENEGVAKSYRDGLGGWKWNGADSIPSRMVGEFDVAHDVKQALNYANGDPAKARAILERDAKAGLPGREDMDKAALALFDEIAPNLNPKANGKMYEVSINADPNDFLDWDRPLSQQSEKVRNGFERSHGDWLKSASPHIENKPVADWIDMLRGRGPSSGFMNEKLSSDLKDAGIPGIRYLDQGSRAAGEGSSNYVVFDDALIDIIRKYMNPQTAIAPGALMVEGAKDRRQ